MPDKTYKIKSCCLICEGIRYYDGCVYCGCVPDDQPAGISNPALNVCDRFIISPAFSGGGVED